MTRSYMKLAITPKPATSRAALLFLCFLLCSTVLQSQITPHSALKNFKLPKYNENSYRAYTLSGIEGIYDKNGFFTVNSAELAIYSGDADQILQTQIITDHANFDLKEDTAYGDSFIEIKDDEFYLKGQSWKLDMKNKRITIEREGMIRFYQDLQLDLSDIF